MTFSWIKCSVTVSLLGLGLSSDVLAQSLRNDARASRPLPAGAPRTGLPREATGRSASAPSGIADVALAAGGTLTGRIVDHAGAPIAGARVVLHQGQQPVGESMSDASGSYSFKSVRGGMYQVTSAGSQVTIRAWKEGTAPPAAIDQALLVTGRHAARGQWGTAIPPGLWLAGTTTSAATLGAVAMSGDMTGPMNALGTASSGHSMASPNGPSIPSGSLAVNLDHPSLHPGLVAGDQNRPVIVCPPPHSP